MKANVKLINKRRKFSKEFKKSIVAHFESGQFSILQLSRLHSIAGTIIYRWIYQFSTFNQKGQRIIEMKDSTENKLKEQTARIKELERLVGQKQIQIEYLEKMIELAKTELDIDLKKNYGTPPSSGSGKTKK